MHVVIGRGGRAKDRAAACKAVVAGAERNGWTVEALSLAELQKLDEPPSRLAILGGDGLIHQCLPIVAGTDCEVGVVPVGSGNDFAAALGLDRELAIAAVTAPAGAVGTTAIDLLSLVGPLRRPDGRGTISAPAVGAPRRLVATVATAGYSGRVNQTANDMRLPLGRSKYTVAALGEIGRLRARPMRVVATAADGTQTVIDDELTLLAIGNTALFGGGMRVCPDADPADGELDMVTVGALSRAEFVRWLPSLFSGKHVTHPAVRHLRAVSVTVRSAEQLWGDGEPIRLAENSVDGRGDGPGNGPGGDRGGASLIAESAAPDDALGDARPDGPRDVRGSARASSVDSSARLDAPGDAQNRGGSGSSERVVVNVERGALRVLGADPAPR